MLAGVDAVVHFAAYIAVGESTREPELYFSNNVGGTVSLLEVMARARVRRLVFSSTAGIYGNPEHVPIAEDARFAPVSPYGESKAILEKILGELDRYRGLRSVALRYQGARFRNSPDPASSARGRDGGADPRSSAMAIRRTMGPASAIIFT